MCYEYYDGKKISFWIFVIIFRLENNEVKCAIIKIQNVNATDDYERTLNRKWPNMDMIQWIKTKLWDSSFFSFFIKVIRYSKSEIM